MNFLKGRPLLWLLVPIAFLVPYLWDRAEQTAPEFIEDSSNPDYYLTQTDTTEFNEQGQIARNFTSAKTLYFKEIMQTRLEQPVLYMTNANGQEWQVSSQTAQSNELSEELTLNGDVTITFDNDVKRTARLTMPDLLLDFASETATTASPLEFTDGLYRMTAIGMFADLHDNTIEFKSEVVTEEL